MGLQYYDKAVLGSASIFGIIKDLVGKGKRAVNATADVFLRAELVNDDQWSHIHHPLLDRQLGILLGVSGCGG